jgi:hypothetical protein
MGNAHKIFIDNKKVSVFLSRRKILKKLQILFLILISYTEDDYPHTFLMLLFPYT